MNKYQVIKAYGDHEVDAVIELDDADAKGLVSAGLIEQVVDADGVADLKEALGTEIKRIAQDAAKSAASEVIEGLKGIKGPAIEVGHDRVLDDPKQGYKHFGEFCADVMNSELKRGTSEQFKAIQGANESTAADGGVLVPDFFAAELGQRPVNGLDLMSMTTNFQVPGNNLTLPALNDYDKSGAATRHGGIQVYWTAEGGTITKSNPAFNGVSLKMHSLKALIPATDELLEDAAIALGQFMVTKGQEALNDECNEAILNGDGIAKPEGVLNAAAKVQVAKESGQSADTVVAGNITRMWASLPVNHRANAIWLYNPEAEQQFPLMQIGDQPVYQPPMGLEAAPFGRLLGRPMYPTDLLPKLGDADDLLLLDPSAIVSITKGTGTEVASSIHLYFDSGQTAFRLTKRLDAKSWYKSSITPKNANSGFSMSPIVTLAARA